MNRLAKKTTAAVALCLLAVISASAQTADPNLDRRDTMTRVDDDRGFDMGWLGLLGLAGLAGLRRRGTDTRDVQTRTPLTR
jgi:MYXO-CTERM domain-containing protein